MTQRMPHTSRPALRAARRLAAAGTASAVLLVAGCGGDGSDDGKYTVRAIFDSASFIGKGLDVRIAGVSAGAVTDVELTDENQAAVTFDITRAGFQDLRQDATCTIRPQALIGERYIECQLTEPRPDGATAPPSIEPLPDGPHEGEHLLPVENTAVPVDPDQLLNVNTGSVRERFALIIRELGAGVAGRGDKIASTLRKSNEGLKYANRILKQLSDQEEMLKGLVSSSDQTLTTLAADRASLTGTVENGAVVAQRLATRKAEVQATIASLSELLDEVEPSVDRVTELTDELQPIADDLNRSSDDLATVLDLLPELSQRGSTALTALAPTLDQGREILTSDTNNALIDRLVNTSAAVKASGSVLGLTLGDFRTTGGLDYFLDTIYGLAYATNGRDGNGSYLRGAVINLLGCALPGSVKVDSCGLRLASDFTGLPASGSRSSTPASPAADADTFPSVDKASADLLLGGTQ